MTDIEQWEPTSTVEALATLDSLTSVLDQAETVAQVNQARSMAEIAIAYIRRHDESQAVILRAQEIMRNAERKLAELMEELRAEGKVRKAGRPKKSDAVHQVSDEQTDAVHQVSPTEIFGDTRTRTAAFLFASVNEDEWNEALAEARETGDMSRETLARMLRTPRAEHAPARADNGDIPTVARVVPRAIKALTTVADMLEGFDPETVEHEDRKEWKAAIREQTDRIAAWQKGLPR